MGTRGPSSSFFTVAMEWTPGQSKNEATMIAGGLRKCLSDVLFSQSTQYVRPQTGCTTGAQESHLNRAFKAIGLQTVGSLEALRITLHPCGATMPASKPSTGESGRRLPFHKGANY
jgi:hypothetical protein